MSGQVPAIAPELEKAITQELRVDPLCKIVHPVALESAAGEDLKNGTEQHRLGGVGPAGPDPLAGDAGRRYKTQARPVPKSAANHRRFVAGRRRNGVGRLLQGPAGRARSPGHLATM